MALLTGVRLGPYEILSQLGAGGERADHCSPQLDCRAEAMTITSGTRLGPYEIIAPLSGVEAMMSRKFDILLASTVDTARKVLYGYYSFFARRGPLGSER